MVEKAPGLPLFRYRYLGEGWWYNTRVTASVRCLWAETTVTMVTRPGKGGDFSKCYLNGI